MSIRMISTLKSIAQFLMAFMVLFSFSCKEKPKPSPTKSEQPNIVLFFVDDLGWQDTSVPFWSQRTVFNDRYHTPNMERLAAEGMKFTQAYATPVCTPTRVSLMTGMNAARHRVTNWTFNKDAIHPMEANHKTLDLPLWNVNGMSSIKGDSLAVHATPLPKQLQNAGYFTVHTGKAHFGAYGTLGENPLNLGFDVNIGGHAAGQPGSYLGEENFGNGNKRTKRWAVPGLEKYHGQDIYITEALTKEALNTLDSVAGKKPFFLYMAHYAVHTPITGDKKYLQKYLDAGIDSTEAKYASMVEGMDKSLGDIMDYLEENQLDDNTIILFMSDNGGLSAVARGGEAHTHNKPLASGKGSIYEGGIREPMLVKWPGVVKPGTTNDNYLIIEDFYPTIIEMAGIKTYSTVQEVDGMSFIPVLTNPEPGQTDDRALFWHYPNEWGPKGPGVAAFSAIRLGDWKLIYYHDTEGYELFNLVDDIGESTNLYEQNKKKAKELASILKAHLKNVDAQLPVHKATGVPVAFP